MDRTKKTNNPLIIQQNTAKRKEAFPQLLTYLIQGEYQIALIQEPQLLSNGTIPVPDSIVPYSCGENPRAAILAKKSANLLLLSHHSTRDICVCEATVNGIKLILISVYFSRNDGSELFQQQLNSLATILQTIKNKKVVIGGDLNGWHQAWRSHTSDSRGEAIWDLIISTNCDLLNCGNRDTFWAEKVERKNGTDRKYVLASKVDLTFVSHELRNLNWTWRVSDLATSSDHRIILFGFNYNNNDQSTSGTTRKWVTQKVDWSDFNLSAANLRTEWLSVLNNCSCRREVDSAVTKILEQVADLCDSSLPKVKLRKYCVPWWNRDLTKLREEFRRMGNKVRRQRPAVREIYLEYYSELKKKYNDAIEAAKFNWFKDQLAAKGRDSIGTLSRQLPRSVPQTVTMSDGTSTETSEETAEFLLHTFLPDDIEADDTPLQKDIRTIAKLSTTESTDDVPFTEQEVRTIVKRLKDKKSPGEDGFSGNIVRNWFAATPDVLTLLYRKCLEYSCFPSPFKTSLVRAVPKHNGQPPDSPKAWRPISLISVPGKILEKLMIDRVMYHLRSLGLLSPLQSGFTPHKSTVEPTSIVIDFVNDIRQQRGPNRKYGAVVSLDISAAFDCAWWPAIIKQLIDGCSPNKPPPRSGVAPNLLNLVRNCFEDRYATLEIAGSRMTKRVTKGCPQGSACGPGFWNILFDAALKLTLPPGCKVNAFADDMLLRVEAYSLHSLEYTTKEAIRRIFAWGDSVKLKFNEKKTQVMVIHHHHNLEVNLEVSGVLLEVVKHFKHLGVVIDYKLLWRNHMDYLKTKILKVYHQVSRVAKNKWGIRSEVCEAIYLGVVEPIILYAAEAWTRTGVLELAWPVKELQQIQRWFLMKICRGYCSVSFEALCIIADVLPIDLKIRETLSLGKIKKCGSFYDNQNERTLVQTAVPRLRHPATDRTENCLFVIRPTASGPTNSAHVKIFTDGSKMESGVGCAFVVYESGVEIHQEAYQLPRYCSVFQAELLAILKALLWVQSLGLVGVVELYSDSLSSLQALMDSDSLTQLVQAIHDVLESLKEVKVEFHWIKAHVGHLGNERADELAKEGTKFGKFDYQKAPFSYAKRVIRSKSELQWNQLWKNNTKGRWTARFFPTLQDRRLAKHFRPGFVVTQYITDMGKFAKYLHMCKHRRSPGCGLCGAEEQNSKHLIRRCRELTRERERLREVFCRIGGNYDYLEHTVFREVETTTAFVQMLETTHQKLVEWEEANKLTCGFVPQ